MTTNSFSPPEDTRTAVLVPATRYMNGLPVDESKCPPMPNPDDAMLASPEFNAIYDVIKDWDVNAPQHYAGYCGLNGSHVAIILNALTAAGLKVVPVEG